MLTVVIAIDIDSYSIIAGPDIITRGFIYVKESEELINECKEIARREIELVLDKHVIEWHVLKLNVKKALERYLYDKTKRRPTIFPIIMEV